jgi:23S rRNA (pseudouridine1915-N3)-methyltransferase
MNLKPLRVISVGRPRAVWFREACGHYLERLGHWRNISETFIRDADAALPPSHKIAEEGRRILAAIEPADIIVCLDERGCAMTSLQFSSLLDNLSCSAVHRPCFVLGGPFGLAGAVLAAARHCIAFGPQTLPHELARVVLLEQLYRAESLLRNTPYHHR